MSNNKDMNTATLKIVNFSKKKSAQRKVFCIELFY